MTEMDSTSAVDEYPQLNEIADPQKLAQKLRQYMGLDLTRHEIESCIIERIDLQSRKCRVLFTANIRDRKTQKTHQQLFFGRVFRSQSQMMRAGSPEKLIHASFKFAHILATDRGVAFIDLDGANFGDPFSQDRINWFTANHLIASQLFKSVKRTNAEPLSQLLYTAERLCVA